MMGKSRNLHGQSKTFVVAQALTPLLLNLRVFDPWVFWHRAMPVKCGEPFQPAPLWTAFVMSFCIVLV